MTSPRTFLRLAVLSLALAAGSATALDAKRERIPTTYDEISKLKPLDVMHMIDEGRKGHVTRKDFMKFQEQFFEAMDEDRDGKITEYEWMDRG